MRKTDRALDRILSRLRGLIRERGFTQTEVQDTLGWGRSYISQLVNRQKSLRVEHVLMILKVIDVEPEVFFAEIYQFGDPRRRHRRGGRAARSLMDDLVPAEPRGLWQLFDGLVSLLVKKKLITVTDLARAIKKAESKQPTPPASGVGEAGGLP